MYVYSRSWTILDGWMGVRFETIGDDGLASVPALWPAAQKTDDDHDDDDEYDDYDDYDNDDDCDDDVYYYDDDNDDADDDDE